MQDTNNNMRKGKPMGQDEYDRIKSMLNTRSPMELSQAGVCGYSTAYKIMSTSGYGDYRNKLREEREKFYAKRKGATQIKRNVPPIGSGSIRFNPPKKALDGTGNTETIFGSPFRENVEHKPKEKPKNGPVVVVRQGTDHPEAVIDVKSGANPAYQPAKDPIILPYSKEVYSAEEARSHNSKCSLSKHGVDIFKFVDGNALDVVRGRKPTEFNAATILGICSLARNGGTGTDIMRYVEKAGYGRKSMDQIVRTIAYNESGLEDFKRDWKAGADARRENIARMKLKGAKSGAKALKAKADERKEAKTVVEKDKELVDGTNITTTLQNFLNDPNADKAYMYSTTTVTIPESSEVTAEDVKKAAQKVMQNHSDNVNKSSEKFMKKQEVKKITSSQMGDKMDEWLDKGNDKRVCKKVKIVRDTTPVTLCLVTGAQTVMLGFKLFGLLALDWVWVFAPIYIWFALMVLELILIGAVAVLCFNDYLKED